MQAREITAPRRFVFDVELEREEGLTCFIRVPPDVMAALGPRKRVPVAVGLGSFSYRATVAAYGGRFYIPVRAEIRQAAGVAPGDKIRVTLESDDAPRVAEIPDDVGAALRAAGLYEAFRGFGFSQQHEYLKWIAGAKKPETREARIAETVEESRANSQPLPRPHVRPATP